MNQKIAECKAGDKPIMTLKLTNIQIKKTSTGGDYASLVGFDGTDRIEAKLWSLSPEQRERLKSGEIYDCIGVVKDYQGKLQYNISDFTPTTDENLDRSLFYEHAVISTAELEKAISAVIDSIVQPELRLITISLIKKHYKEYFLHPAAVTMHHSYTSGLAYHVYSMLTLAEPFLTLYPFLSADLVHAGIILHDIGKLEELTDAKTLEYTPEGNLLGHIVIGVALVREEADALSIGNSDAILALEHIILSHHGTKEFGSPKEPQICEAEVVHLVDYADSRMAALDREMKDVTPGTFTAPIPAFDRRSFYVPRLSSSDEEEASPAVPSAETKDD